MESASTVLTRVVTAAMKPYAAAGGYKKERLNYRRRRGSTQQIVNFQLSPGNSAAEARCYVNVSIAFDAVFALLGREPPVPLKEFQGHFRARLEDLVAGAPLHWEVSASTYTAAIEAELGKALGQMTAWLDAIDGPAAMLATGGLRVGAQHYLRAQLHYVEGQLDAALAAVRAGVAFFAERGATTEKATAELGLEALAGRS